MELAIRILGCGSSGGVPRLGDGWGQCDPCDVKNVRRRCSILIEGRDNPSKEPTRLLIDMSPDLRLQLLDAKINRLDGIVITHPHADHIHGIDDIRPLVIFGKRRLDLYMNAHSSRIIRASFGYIFETPESSLYPPLLNEKSIVAETPFSVMGPGGELVLLPFLLHHGEIDALGLRVGNCAYTPDVHKIPEHSVDYLRDLDVWILDALRFRPHPSHFNVAEALAWIDRMRPRRAILTNLHNDLDYHQLKSMLPSDVEPAYDGMEIFSKY